MNSLRFIDRRAGYSLGALGLLLGMVTPAVFPAFASAYTVLSGRSIQMSSATASATGVTYKLTFTPSIAISSGGGFIVDFCDSSPILGGSCTTTPPAGMSTTSAVLGTVSSAGTLTNSTNGRLKFTASATIPASADSYEFTTITNPSAVGTFYARVYTYADATALGNYSSITSIGSPQDAGGVAMSTVNAIGVSATVMETMTFCTAPSTWTPATNCSGASAPSLVLGTGSPAALGTTTQTAGAFAELSTNASSGAVVNMKNSNNCGGLRRVSAGAATCDIAPTNTSTSLAAGGQGLFGLNVGTANTSLTGASGTLTALAPYSTTNQYGMTYSGSINTGVSSVYGDPIFNSGGNPVSNVYLPLTFAANASNVTPAGVYSAQMDMIATGTF